MVLLYIFFFRVKQFLILDIIMKKVIALLIGWLLIGQANAQRSTDEALALQYYQQSAYEKAIPLFEKIFNSSHNTSLFEFYYNSLIKIKKYKEAEELTKKLSKQYPYNFQYQIALGRVYQESGKTSEANKIYLKCIQNLQKNEFQVRELANTFFRFEAYDMAVNTFLHGRRILENEQLFTFELLNIYRFKKDKERLINEYLNALPYNPQLMAQAKNVLANLFEDRSDYQQLQNALLKKIQKDPQNEAYAELLIWQFIQQQEYEMALRQLLALDRRTKTSYPLIYQTADIFITNKAYGTAAKAFEYLINKGPDHSLYLPAKIQLINTKYELAIQGKADSATLKALAHEFSEIVLAHGINNQTLFAVKKLAHLQAYYLNQLDIAEKTLEKALSVPSLPASEVATLKLELGDVYVLNQQPWEAVLIYEQVAKQYESLPVGSEARYRSAKLSFYQGNFKYAKSQADVLKASTSQLIANDALNLSLLISDNLQSKNDSLALIMYADAELLQFVNHHKAALLKLDSIAIAFPYNSLSDDILMARAKIHLKTQNYELAKTALQELISLHYNSIWIDDALFALANLYEEQLSNPQEAKKLYQQLITDFPGSMLTTEARKRYRNIRGDNLGT